MCLQAERACPRKVNTADKSGVLFSKLRRIVRMLLRIWCCSKCLKFPSIFSAGENSKCKGKPELQRGMKFTGSRKGMVFLASDKMFV